MGDRKYPYFATKESEFDKHQRFTGFYMPDVEFDKLQQLFPNGCHDRSVTLYDIPLYDSVIIDYVYLLDEEQRSKFFDEEIILKDKKIALIWDWNDLLHLGYHPVWNLDLKLACCKGKIKPNKHTVIVVLDTIPKRVLKSWKDILNHYIIPMQALADKYCSDFKDVKFEQEKK